MLKRVRKAPKVDLSEELIASMTEVVQIAKGEVAPSRVHHPVAVSDVDVRAARERLGLSQPAFALRFGVALPTLRKWEQGRRRPDGPARVLLKVIEKEPDAVRRALLVDAD